MGSSGIEEKHDSSDAAFPGHFGEKSPPDRVRRKTVVSILQDDAEYPLL